MKTFSCILVIAVAVVGSAVALNYCDSSLCTSSTHIGCGHNGQFDSTCPADAQMIDLTPTLQQRLVDAHNAKRNHIAGGNDANHDPACRMATMEWDQKMADVAAFNVRQCAMRHDKCRNTDDFKYSGQNLAWIGYFEPLNVEAQLDRAVQMWYDEVKDSRMEYINAYPANYQGPVIGHYTVMVAEKNTRVGCAASIYSVAGQSYKALLVACNYATTNMINFPIYNSCSSAGTGCTTGSNPTYPNLCSKSEVFNVNQWF